MKMKLQFYIPSLKTSYTQMKKTIATPSYTQVHFSNFNSNEILATVQ